MICVVTVACLLSDNCWEMLWDRTLGAQSLIRVIDTLIYSLMGEILNQLQKFKQTKTLPFIRMFTSINWCKNLWIESLCCSWFMLVQFSITDSILYNIYIYIQILFVSLIWFPAQNTRFFHGEKKPASPWTTPAGESIAECFWAIASWHPGDGRWWIYRNRNLKLTMKIPWKIPWVVGSPKGGYSLKKTIQKKIGAMFVSFRECRKIGCSVTGKAVIFYHVDLFCTLALYAKKSLKSELHTVYLLLAMWECLWGSRCRLSGWSLPQLWRTQGVSLAIEWQLKSELKVLSVCPKNKASWYVWCIWSMKPSILLRFFFVFFQELSQMAEVCFGCAATTKSAKNELTWSTISIFQPAWVSKLGWTISHFEPFTRLRTSERV